MGVADTIRRLFDGDEAGAKAVFEVHAPLPLAALSQPRWGQYALHQNPRLDWRRLLGDERPPFEIDLKRLSRNGGTWWTSKLIADHEDDWSWTALSVNPSLPWDARLIHRFRDRWDWSALSVNRGIPWSSSLIKKHKSQLVPSRLAANSAIEWDADLLRRLGRDLSEPDPGWHPSMRNERPEYVASGVRLGPDGWYHLQQNPSVRWDEVLDRLPSPDWHLLARNRGLTWTRARIRSLEGTTSWADLARNPGLPWNDSAEELLAGFEGLHRWSGISGNPAIPWTRELLDRYAERLSWGQPGLSSAGTLTEDLVQRYADRLDWDWGTTTNPHLPWSEGFLRTHRERWNWERLGFNRHLPWSAELVANLAGYWVLRSFARHDEAWDAVSDALDAEFLERWCAL